jgi:hypothetical protein
MSEIEFAKGFSLLGSEQQHSPTFPRKVGSNFQNHTQTPPCDSNSAARPSGASDQTTLTVLRSHAVGCPDGRVAILLHTKELGSIAFELDQGLIETIRRAATLLRQWS